MGYEPCEIIGKTLFDFKNTKHIAEMFDDIISSQLPFNSILIKTINKNGIPVTFESSGIPIFDNDGKLTGYQGINRDVTERISAQKSLRESKELAELYLNTAQVMLLALDIDAKITLINPKGCEILGYSKEELIGKKWFDFCIPKDAHNDIQEVFEYCIDGPEEFIAEYENAILRKDGSRRLIKWYNAQLLNDSGDVIGTISSGNDITEKQKAIDELCTSEEKYRTLFESSRDALLMFAPPLWRFTSANSAAIQLFGAQNESDITKLGPWDLSPKHQPDGRLSNEKVHEVIAIAMQEGSNFFEWEHQKVDGTVFLCDVMLTLIEFNNEVSILGVVRDITERKNLEKEFRKKSNFLDSVINSMKHGMYIYNLSTNKNEFINSQYTDITGWTKKELNSMSQDQFMGLFHPEDVDRVLTHMQLLKSTNEYDDEIEYRFKTKDGHWVWFHSKDVVFERDESGKCISILGTFFDISKRKEMEAEIKKKDEMMIAQSRQAAMGDMIAMIAHQWRQPISIIGMEANNMKLDIELEEEITTEDLVNMTDSITEQTEHLSKTIDNFRNFFQPNQVKKLTTLGEVLEGTMSMLGKSLENNNITVDIQNRSDKKILTYSNQLLQVFLNILSNAKDILKNKALGEAKITIMIDESEESIITIICDNGGGIPEDAIKRLGEPYFTTKGNNGTGLGLYMSKTIVRKHLNGDLTWKNRDNGACFIITLPKE